MPSPRTDRPLSIPRGAKRLDTKQLSIVSTSQFPKTPTRSKWVGAGLGVLLTVASMLSASDITPDRLSLAGEWRFALDPKNEGARNEWFHSSLPDVVNLPGTISLNKKGPRLEPNDNVKELSSEFPYEGLAWYQRTIQIPEKWRGRSVDLSIERSKITTVWVDDLRKGHQDALGVAQVYHLGELSPGSHRLTICVDNKTIPPGVSGHMVITATQTKWNGLIGDLHLAVHDPVWIEQVHVTPDVTNKMALLTLSIGNTTGVEQKGRIVLSASPFNVPEAKHSDPIRQSSDFCTAPGGSTVSIRLPLGDKALLWDEFHPALYRLKLSLETHGSASNPFHHSAQTEFGLRDFKTKNGQFTINGRTIMLRGKHDGLVFPKTGHVAMDLKEWMRVLTIAKSYGINHYRFHTCTPPEAAFQAADRVGIYMQPEFYHNGGNFENGPAGEYSLAECQRILSTYNNHPSFVMFALGNEIWGGRDNRQSTVAALKKFDPSRLYAEGSNNEFGRPVLAAGDDYWTTARTARDSSAHAVRGSFSHADKPLGHIQCLRPATTFDFREAIQGIPIPVIGHEVGQFQIFPDFREIPQYTGVQKPWNFETFRRRLATAGMLDQAGDFVAASGALAVQCYREDIETALRTPGFGGFQLLDLQDYPGQGSALVGILNAFMQSKGLIRPEQWRNFCGPVVPLARMSSYTWMNSQTFTAQVDVAQYGPHDLKNIPLTWTLEDRHGNPAAEGVLPPRDYSQGLVPAGCISIPLAHLKSPARYNLKLRLGRSGYHNQYPLWVYPDHVDTQAPADVIIRQTWDPDTQAMLRAGRTVVLMPPPDSVPGVEGFFTTDYWSFPMFRSCCESSKKAVAPGTLGLLIQANHPALASFPTATHSDWQWWDLVMGSRALVLDATPASFRPIVQTIDNFERNHKLAVLFECKVEKGKLLVCSLDLLHKQDSPVARQMLHSLQKYAQSEFHPQSELSMQSLNAIFAQPSPTRQKNPDGSFSEFFDRKE